MIIIFNLFVFCVFSCFVSFGVFFPLLVYTCLSEHISISRLNYVLFYYRIVTSLLLCRMGF